MRTRLLVTSWIAVAVLASGAAAGTPADNGFIGIYADREGTQPCATIAPGTAGTLYLVATLAGGTSDGFTGAEFRIEVTRPAGYYFSYEAPLGAISLGNPLDLTPEDPFDTAWIAVAFGTCQTRSRVQMGTLQVYNASGSPTELHVKRANRPTNPAYYCPLFVLCNAPTFDKACMRACAVDSFGGAIVFRASLNDPGCALRPCPGDLPGAGCATLTATVSSPVCAGAPITVTATATNCSPGLADVDVYVEYVLAGSFAGVLPGGSVTASRTYTQPGCAVPEQDRPAIGAVVRTAACPEPYGAEIGEDLFCVPGCSPNRPPDCSQARLSVPTLWPPDGRFVPVHVEGVTDPDGDPVSIQVLTVAQEEMPGTFGRPDCPDGYIDGPNQVRLRAERDQDGDGRMYRIAFLAKDVAGAECNRTVYVCVPRKPEFACDGAGFGYLSTSCESPTRDREGRGPSVTWIEGAGAVVRLRLDSESDARVEIFDVRGRRLASLGHGRFAAGEHVLRWDGRDAARGVYFIRVHTAGEVATTRFVLVR